jgi:hypothetical protein
MTSVATLSESISAIVEDAYAELHPSIHPHYGVVGAAVTRQHLRALAQQVVAALENHEAVHVVRDAERIAAERFDSGYRVAEVQAAFNAVEQAMWARVLEEEDHQDVLATLVQLSSVFGAGKDALARTWVDLVARRHRPPIDLPALVEGNECTAAGGAFLPGELLG